MPAQEKSLWPPQPGAEGVHRERRGRVCGAELRRPVRLRRELAAITAAELPEGHAHLPERQRVDEVVDWGVAVRTGEAFGLRSGLDERMHRQVDDWLLILPRLFAGFRWFFPRVSDDLQAQESRYGR